MHGFWTNSLFAVLWTALAIMPGCASVDPESEPVSEAQQALVPEPWDEFVDHFLVGVHRVVPDGTIEYANPADYVGLGYTEAEYVGHDIREFHVSQATIEWMLTHLLNGGQLIGFPAVLKKKGGGQQPVLIWSEVDGVHGHTRCGTVKVSWAMYWLRLAEIQ